MVLTLVITIFRLCKDFYHSLRFFFSDLSIWPKELSCIILYLGGILALSQDVLKVLMFQLVIFKPKHFIGRDLGGNIDQAGTMVRGHHV